MNEELRNEDNKANEKSHQVLSDECRNLRLLLVVPARNEEPYIEKCLDSLVDQIDGFPNARIVCIDGDSTDRTRELILKYCEKYPKIELLDNPACIKPISENLALKKYPDGIDAYFILDVHSRYPANYVESCLEVLFRTGADIVGGYCNTVPGMDRWTGRVIARAATHRFAFGAKYRAKKLPECESDCVPFGCYRTDFFQKFGLFDERMVRNQDTELYARARKKGARIVLSPKIEIDYFCRSTFKGIVQQCFNNGKWNVYSTYFVGYGLQLRHYVPFVFVLTLLVLGIASFFSWGAAVGLLGIVSAYSACALFSSFQAAGKDITMIPALFVTFWLLHLSYGIGSLAGIVTLPTFAMKSRQDQSRPIADRIQ